MFSLTRPFSFPLKYDSTSMMQTLTAVGSTVKILIRRCRIDRVPCVILLFFDGSEELNEVARQNLIR